ncbi:S8 family peptidase [Abyssisolibacter fermentans]|uniref:S8 family peptidase n=1 Tax=Abyssisolibacter fermentans TaxID=1766203 RepID=UPI00138EF661|nr:S8 family serine peptidase [Abyssisolibacter fermentans]
MQNVKENMKELELSNCIQWWKKGYKGQGVTVLVLDDEGDRHKWFDEKIITGAKFHDGIGHNTNVTKVIRTLAPDVNIIMYNCFGKKSDTDKEVLQFIKTHDIDLINISYSTFKRSMYEEINKLDIPMICAAGNAGNDNSISYPARLPFTISVGAFKEARWDNAHYSNEGEELDCMGFTDVYVWNSRKDRIFVFTGTSCATPYVTGILALYLSYIKANKLPKPTIEELKSFIHENCIDLYDKGHDTKSGYGLFILPNLKELKVKYIFKDIQDHWAKKDIQEVVSKGLMNGYPDETFKPNKQVTRAELAVTLNRLIKMEG